MLQQLDAFSRGLEKVSVIVLDKASLCKKMGREQSEKRDERGLCVGFLPPYSPHLNIVEILRKKLKREWLQAKDYANKETLHGTVSAILQAVETTYRIAFSPFKMPPIGLT